MLKTRLPLIAIVMATSIPITAYAEDFNGPFLGLATGYNRDSVGPDLVVGAPTDFEASRSVATFAAFTGYDFHLWDQFVIGAEGSVGISADDQVVAQINSTQVEVDPIFSFDLSIRAGFIVKDKALIYLRSGYHSTRLRASVSDGVNRDVVNGYLEGWLAGGGVEYAIRDHVTMRMEYRYADLGEKGSSFNRHQVLAGIAYRF